MNYRQNYYDYLAYVRTLDRKKGQGVYYEEHHILPKCIGGSNKKENRILLTAREHFLAHYLLCKIYPEDYQLLYALQLLRKNSDNSKLFECIRPKIAEVARRANLGKRYTSEINAKKGCRGKRWFISDSGEELFEYPDKVDSSKFHLGKGSVSEETRSKMIFAQKRIHESQKGIPRSPETKRRIHDARSKVPRRWIYNKNTLESILIPRTSELPDEFEEGRFTPWQSPTT